MLELLGNLLNGLRTREGYREADKDLVRDLMDVLAGWCHPDARLVPDNQG